MKRTTTFLALFALMLMLASGCGEAETEVEVAAAPVVLVPVEVRALEERIEVTGELIARNRSVLAAEVAGRVSEVIFDEGQAVEAGQVILEIDPERRKLDLASARAGHAEARAGLRDAERDFGRVRKLHAQEIASQQRLDQARTAYELAAARADASAAQVHIAERALRDASLTAPFSGRIAERFVSRGEFVNLGQRLVDLVALDPIELEFHLAERDTSRIAVGQTLAVLVDAHPGERFDATVTMISPTIDSRTRTLRVLARLGNSEGRLRPGLFARADLGVAQRDAVVMVPEEAVLQRADGAVVFRLGPENRVLRVQVETGVHREGKLEIRSGLGSNDQVVARGQADLIDGQLISPRNRDGTPVDARFAGGVPVEPES